MSERPQQFCLVFDLDDTLYLERHYVASGFAAVGEWVRMNLNIEGFTEMALQEFEAGARGDIFNRALADLGVPGPASLIAQLVSAYRTHSPAIELEADASACLRRYRGRAALAMITDGHPESQQRKLAALGLAQSFSPLVLTGAWGPEFSKPNPRAFEYVAAHAGSQIRRFVYLADNPAKDFQAPAAMGWKTIRIRRRGGLHSTAPNAPDCSPAAELPDLSRVAEYLGC